MDLGLYDFVEGKSITGVIGRGGPWKSRFAHGHFRAHKSLDFQGPRLPMALKMDVAHNKLISSLPI